MLLQYFLAAFLLLSVSFGQPVHDNAKESLLVMSDEAPKTNETPKEPRPPQLKSMNVVSNVRNRYARTVVTSKYANPEESAQQATFSIVLPDTAFIAGFVMEIDGKKYEAYVKEKEEAKKEYEQAVSQGLGAAHVAVSARDSNKFTVSVNVEPQSKVVFNLTYEELLVRKHGKYEMVVNLHPGQIIKQLGIDVNINETRPIINVDTPALRSGNEITNDVTRNEYATIKKDSDGVVHVSFHPTVDQQKEMSKLLKNNTTDGISGQFIIEYDVERDPLGGEVLVNDGYFVHFFAPSELKPIPKHIVFVLDVSGSMYGRKIEQLKQAMKVILGELNPEDYFNLVKFHSTVHILNGNNSWEYISNPEESELPQGIEASAENIKNAQDIVEQMTDEGATNIYDALLVSLRLSSKGIKHLKETDNIHKPQPMIVFLTDGQANVGTSTNSDSMIEMVEERNAGGTKTAIFTLAFGNDANKEFLKELGAKNSGFSRKIYEAADASLQLQDFYKQISSPLLTNVNFKYSEEVKDVTKHNYDILFKGSEFVVAGRIDKEADKFVTVEGSTLSGKHRYIPICTLLPTLPKPEGPKQFGSLERLWAYLTIKQLLDKKYEKKLTNNTTEETPEKQALKLALKYSFVTPVTSLVVVKPNQTESTNTEDIGDRPQHRAFSSSSSYPGQVPSYHQSIRSGSFSPRLHGFSSHLAPQSISYDSMSALPVNFYSANLSPHYYKPLSLSTTPTTPKRSNYPIWLERLINSAGKLSIDNKEYEIGNNGTSVEHKSCKVESLNISGNCTLLSACPKIYPTLDNLETYKTYFCTLESDRYAGVCCSESTED